MDSLAEYPFTAKETQSTRYLWSAVQSLIPSGSRVFEIGCGNGGTAARLSAMGCSVVAVDTSEAGIAHAKARAPSTQFHVASAYDDLVARFGVFTHVVSLEVIEHCFYPRKFAKTAFNLTAPGGMAIISTPYHGYWKNLALALSGKMDSHFTALWDGGHIKFWSERTLKTLLLEAGFKSVSFKRVGRIPVLAKSMIAIARN